MPPTWSIRVSCAGCATAAGAWKRRRRRAAGCAVRLRFDAGDEALQFALSFAGGVEAIEPPELRAKGLAGARAIIERYKEAA
jgi:predicted DNA-binding transcriptional regulator YafY